MADFSLTQKSEQSPDIFANTSGFPLSVYLDVNPEIIARPRLIRLLRASGADICHNPSSAAILLINSETESGRKFVHDWSADSHKTMLNYGWIQACLRTGRALLEAEGWGGYRVLHTNCIYSDEEGDEDPEDAQSGTRPLTALQTTPLKRETSLTPPSRGKASRKSTRLKPSSPPPEQDVKFDMPSHAHRPTSSGRSASNAMPVRSPLSTNASSTIPPPPKFAAGMSTQATPIRPHTVPTIDKHTHHTSPLSQQSSAPPPYPFPQVADMATSVLSHSQAPGSSTSQTSPLSTNYSGTQRPPPSNSTDLLNALNYAFQIQNTASQVQNVASQTLTQLVETVIAVAQGQGLDTGIFQNYLATLPMPPPPAQQSASQGPASQHVEEHPASSVSDPSVEEVNKSLASTSTPVSLVSSEPSLPPKRKRKSLDLPPPVKKATPNPRQNPSGTLPEAPQAGRGVFAKNGRPILVFVQIDTRGRHEIVHQIKKNGGKITADIPKAAFVILNPRSVSYADLRQEADDSGRTIVQTSFVTESIKQGHLLDPNDFLLGDASSPRKLYWSGHRPTSFHDKNSPESDHVISEAQTSDTVVDSAPSVPARGHTVSPEPPPAVQSKNGFKFTPAEMTYAWALVGRIITKDQLANKLTVVRALHNKMPHHPVASWMSTITRNKEIYEAVRTEALSSAAASGARPPDSEPQGSTHHPRNETSDVEMKGVDRDTEELEELQVGASLIPAAEGDPVHDNQRPPLLARENGIEHDAYSRDFEALVEFLTSAETDGGRDDEIFERLAAKSICMTAPSWPDFLERHADAVTKEVERRYTIQQAT